LVSISIKYIIVEHVPRDVEIPFWGGTRTSLCTVSGWKRLSPEYSDVRRFSTSRGKREERDAQRETR
jgi:hypothetical protein